MSDTLKLPHQQSDTFFSDHFAAGRFSRWKVFLFIAAITFAVCILIFYFFWWRAPSNFPQDMLLAIQKGTTVEEAGRVLREANLVRSEFWFKLWSVTLGGRGGIRAGEYYFAEPMSVFSLVSRLASGRFEVTPVKVTIPEGSNLRQIASILHKALPRMSETQFLRAADGREGYLFPDTYVFQQTVGEGEIVAKMEKNFDKRIAEVLPDVEKFGKTLSEVMVMASLLEEEARTSETRRQIAGILWKRLEIGMPLQVDAVFPYIMGKNTFELSTEDLLYDSPYNTYKYAGLPPTPITNPGLDAIRAAVTPMETPYLYYLSDKKGEMHYAVNHLQHLTNKEKYLR